jgi:formylglycine-generating enzyme required for sulfatase activity
VEEKESVVLMPLHLFGADKALQASMEAAIVDGLQNKYTVVSGEVVANGVKEIYQKESAKKDCNADRCLVEISVKFKVGLIAIAEVNKIEGGYLTALSIRDVYSNEVKSKQLTCKGCDSFQVVDKHKELSSLFAPAAPVVANAPIAIPEPAAPAIKSTDAESALWEEVKKGNTAEDYQAYLNQYPKGKYIALAKAKLTRMKDDAKAAADQQDQQAWNDAQQTASQTAYENYLAAYPQGRFTALASARISKLKKDEADAEAKQRREQLAAEAKQKREAAEAEQRQEAERKRQQREAAEAAARGPKIGQVFKDCNDCAEMVVLPAGNFMMGGTSGREAPAHRVTIGKPFALGKTEVTQAQWQAVMGNNPSSFTNCGSNCPVEQVSWDDVQTFIQKLNQKTGKQYRLPTEAEWEYAARAGTTTAYPWGEQASHEYANYGTDACCAGLAQGRDQWVSTSPAGSFPPNAFGLYDMIGNVWEWTADSYHANYNGAPTDGTEWQGDGAKRVHRGGSWLNNPQLVRAALRDDLEPAYRFSINGFRLARTLP